MNLKKYTTDSYIKECNIIHNNKYDYSLVEYEFSMSKIRIICREHGEFEQRAQLHINGSSCIKCYKDSRNPSSDDFITKCKLEHKNKYDYSKTVFSTMKGMISINCMEHGVFNKVAKNHLKGQGCPKCSKLGNSIKQDNFIKRSNSIHNIYDYSLVNYINHKTKVEIICREHGAFFQTPNNHMIQKKGCPKCNGGVKYNLEIFISKSKEKHNNIYDYSLVKYINNKTKVKIICKEHGVFEQIANAHMRGQKCPLCSTNNRKITSNEFIRKSKEKHNEKYDYSKINFTGLSCYVSIVCDCGLVFSQRAKNHLHGNGCPKCNSKNISKSETKWLDVLGIPNDFRHKTIKINNKNYFLDAVDIKSKIIYEFYGDYWHGNPNIYNKEDINKNNKKTFGELYQNTIDRENILKKNGYKFVTIWESDFKKMK